MLRIFIKERMIYSHTVSPSGVTFKQAAKRRFARDKGVSSLANAARPHIRREKRRRKISRYRCAIALVCGRNSSTVGMRRGDAGRVAVIENQNRPVLHLNRRVLLRYDFRPACQITFPLSLSTAMTPEVAISRLISTSHHGVTDRPS